MSRILEHWPLVESDFQSVYGLDLSSRKLRRRKTWRWFLVRVNGLLTDDTRLFRALAPRDEPTAAFEPDKEMEL